MPQNDLDELTGRTIDGVSRAARYLAAFDMIRDAILAGDLGYERAATEETARRWAALSHEERLEVAHPMVGKLGELSDAYRTAVAAMDVPYEASRRETQASISRWAEETFGPSGSNARAVARANREMSELLEHVTSDDQHPEAAEEVADIVIVLYRVATRLGVDLHELIDKKMAKNRARKWRLDGTGHGYHVKDGEADGHHGIGEQR